MSRLHGRLLQQLASIVIDTVGYKFWYILKDNCEFCLGERGGVLGNENRVPIRGYPGEWVVMCDYCSVDFPDGVDPLAVAIWISGDTLVFHEDSPTVFEKLSDFMERMKAEQAIDKKQDPARLRRVAEVP